MSDLTRQQWQRIEALFERVVDLPRDERSDVLDRECDGDTTVRREVESLVRSERDGGERFLERSAAGPGDDRVEGRCSREAWFHAYQEINQTEEMLTNDGVLIVKFWLHISKKQQKKRLKKAETDPYFRYEVMQRDWEKHKLYDDYLIAVEEMLERTSSHVAPWVIVESGDKRYCRMKIFQVLSESIVNAINRKKKNKSAKKLVDAAGGNGGLSVPVLEEMPTILDKVDLSLTMDEETYDEEKRKLQVKLREMQYEAMTRGIPLIVIYEGWDAAGKGGSIRRLTATLDPRYYDVIPVSKPTPEEHVRHYLWRFWQSIPPAGKMTIFDRSWYGRVLVERVEGFATEEEWRRAYQEINEFELQLYNSGMGIVKFWIHISPEEQLNRFESRQNDPHKSWKLTDEDWRNREKWDQYREAVDEMIKRTSTTYAPWRIIEGDSKQYARVRAMREVIAAWEESIERHKEMNKKKK